VGLRVWEANCSDERSANNLNGVLMALRAYELAQLLPALHDPSRNYLTSVINAGFRHPLKRPIFSVDVAVQTGNYSGGSGSQPRSTYRDARNDLSEAPEVATLSASDLASILKWSKDISSDINLSSGDRIH
jgi:hypothetical protein